MTWQHKYIHYNRIKDNLEEIKRMRADGMTFTAIEARFRLGRGSVKRAFEKLGLIEAPKQRPHHVKTDIDTDDFSMEFSQVLGFEMRFQFFLKIQEAFFCKGITTDKIGERTKLLQKTIGKSKLAEIETMSEFWTVYDAVLAMLGEGR